MIRSKKQVYSQKNLQDMVLYAYYLGKYISRALTLFFGEDQQFVTIKAAESIIDRALWVAEVMRRKVPDLHQIITLQEQKIVDVFMPKQQGLIKVEKERYLTIIEILLTKKPTEIQKKAPGYQQPLSHEGKQFLTKKTWEESQKQRQERRPQPIPESDDDYQRGQGKRGQNRREQDRRQNTRGQQRTRGQNRRRGQERTRGGK